MLKFTMRVRKDGAINLRKEGRQALGIAPYSDVEITIDRGKCVLKPLKYHCAVCGNKCDNLIDDTGICDNCNTLIVNLIKSGKVTTIGDAIKAANRKFGSKYKPY